MANNKKREDYRSIGGETWRDVSSEWVDGRHDGSLCFVAAVTDGRTAGPGQTKSNSN